MTAVAVRLPDQFRPSRDTPMAATPTCCCCCCCCFSTLITSSIVLPMRVELLAREAPSPPPSQVATSKALAAAAPVVSLASAAALAWATRSFALFLAAFVLVMLGLLAAAFAPFGQGTRSVLVTGAYVGAFALEFFLGFVGALGTAGLGYLVAAVLGGVGVFRSHKRRLADGQAPPTAQGAAPPPPLPRPPSSGEPL